MLRPYILWNQDIKPSQVNLVGKKYLNLKQLGDLNINVPQGFCITSAGYQHFLSASNLSPAISKIIENLEINDTTQLTQASQHLKNLILSTPMPADLQGDILQAYQQLTNHNPIVTLRSTILSTNPDTAFTGQTGPYLNLVNQTQLIQKIKFSWAALFETNCLFLAAEQNENTFDLNVVIQVQEMINAQSSGIMFTSSPHSRHSKSVVIESIYGLSLPLMQAEIAPDHFELSRTTHSILYKLINQQTHQLLPGQTTTELTPIDPYLQNHPSLTDQTLQQLAKYGEKIHNHFKQAQELEWAYSDDQLYFLSTHDIQTIPQLKKQHQLEPLITTPILSGTAASPGAVTGTVKIILSPQDYFKLKAGDILVTHQFSADYITHLKRAAAVITDHGGQTSHAAILSRELGIPCIVGTRIATKQLKNNQVITVDAHTGKVYLNKLSLKPTKVKLPQGISHIRQIKTKTQLMVNLSEPDIAAAISTKHVDGVGLLRSEFIVSEYIGIHPRQLLFQNKKAYYIKKLAEGITQVCKAFKDRPVIYRTTDFTSQEYRQLKGGFRYEIVESNPMIGLRGVARYLQDPNVFLLELEAFKKVRSRGYTNLHLMLPYVQTVDQLKDIKKLMYHHGVKRTPNLFLYMAIEVPSNILLLNDFIDVGLDGITIGSNDLTMLILGADRDNETVSHIYNEQDPAVLAAMEMIIKTAKKRKLHCSICGQAPSTNPELVQKLVKWGISSISVSPDVIDQTRLAIKRNETNLSKNQHRHKDPQ